MAVACYAIFSWETTCQWCVMQFSLGRRHVSGVLCNFLLGDDMSVACYAIFSWETTCQWRVMQFSLFFPSRGRSFKLSGMEIPLNLSGRGGGGVPSVFQGVGNPTIPVLHATATWGLFKNLYRTEP